MELGYRLAFVVFPYIALTVFVIGHGWRYLDDRYRWNAMSSEFLEKRELFYGATIFHWGILLALFGHVGGLLIPQAVFDFFGIDARAHAFIAHYSGLVAGGAALAGLYLLLRRRMTNPRIRLTTRANDFITLGGLILVVATGLYNVLFGEYHILDTVAPWIRSILTFTVDPNLMSHVPWSYKVHVLSGLALLAFSPFSRLVHIWSAPIGYFFRGWIEFRRRVVE